MRNFGSGTVLRYRLGPGTWRILLLAALLCLLPLGAGSAHAAGNAASPARQAGSAAAHDWRSIYKHNITHADLYGIACPTSRTCVVVGTGGTILTTSDGGATWRSRTSGTTNDLWGIACPSASNWLAVGQRGTILASRGGASSWSSRTFPVVPAKAIATREYPLGPRSLSGLRAARKRPPWPLSGPRRKCRRVDPDGPRALCGERLVTTSSVRPGPQRAERWASGTASTTRS